MFSKKNWNRLGVKLGLVSGAVMMAWGLGGDCFPDNYYAALAGLSVDTAVSTWVSTIVGNALGA